MIITLMLMLALMPKLARLDSDLELKVEVQEPGAHKHIS